MGSDIDQGTAALQVFVREYAPGRNAAAANGMSLSVVDLAEVSVVAHGLQGQGILTAAVLVTDREDAAALLLSVKHLLSVCGGRSHRLFADNILARHQRIDGQLAVADVRGQNVDRLDLRLLLEHFAIVRVNLRVRGTVFLSRFLSALGDNVAERNDLKAIELRFQRGKMFAVGDTAAADDTDFDFRHDRPP